jgi:poly-gamma-glutamate synthesis protein (capsule biosynthesis protein)
VNAGYIWGDALAELERVKPDARIINLETSITVSGDYWRGKDIHYRMHPENVDCLTAARIDACSLANNHVLDYGYAGLAETLVTLGLARIQTAGAGPRLDDARAPAVVPLANDARLLVFAFATETSGVPSIWAARESRPGVDLLPDLSVKTAAAVLGRIRHARRPHDVVAASIHWGSNWGYDVPREHVQFAHWLIDGGVDAVHGHSSHHPRPIEVYRQRLILYGCGDFINDYEGIEGYEQYRGDLALMYFATLSATGELTALEMTPMQIRRMRLNRASTADAEWMRDTLNRAGRALRTRVELTPRGALDLRWTNDARD